MGHWALAAGGARGALGVSSGARAEAEPLPHGRKAL